MVLDRGLLPCILSDLLSGSSAGFRDWCGRNRLAPSRRQFFQHFLKVVLSVRSCATLSITERQTKTIRRRLGLVKRFILLCTVVYCFSVWSSSAQAQFGNLNSLASLSSSNASNLSLTGSSFSSFPGQNALLGVSGNLNLTSGTLLATLAATANDPSPLTFTNTITNNTGSALNSVLVLISEPFDFSIIGPTTGASTTIASTTTGWSGTLFQPVQQSGSNWTAEFQYTGGSLPAGSPLNFSYQVSVSGSTSYPLTESIKGGVVPEPGTLALLLAGLSAALAVGGRAFWRSRG
jgi:hypothetical protein